MGLELEVETHRGQGWVEFGMSLEEGQAWSFGVKVCKGVGDGKRDSLEAGKKVMSEWAWGWERTSYTAI